MVEHLERLAESSPPITHIRRQALDRLNIVSIHIKAALSDNLDHVEIAAKVTSQRLDQQRGLLVLNLADSFGKVPGAAVDEVVTVDAGEDDVAQAPAGESLGRVLGLMGIQGWRRAARLDAAEAAAAGAGVAHEHNGGRGGALVGAAPALGDVGAAGLLADGVQLEAAQVGLDLLVVVVARGDGRLEPLGQAGDGALLARGADLGGAQLVGFRLGHRLGGRAAADKVGQVANGRVLEVRLASGRRCCRRLSWGRGHGGEASRRGRRGGGGYRPSQRSPGALEGSHWRLVWRGDGSQNDKGCRRWHVVPGMV